MKTRLLVRVAWLAIAALGAGCGRNADRLATAPEVRGVSSSSNIVTLPFDAAHFQNPKPNVLFPLVPGTTDTYRGVSRMAAYGTSAGKRNAGMFVRMSPPALFIASKMTQS